MTLSSKQSQPTLTAFFICTTAQVLCATYLLRLPHFAPIASVLFFAAGLYSSWCLLRLPAPAIKVAGFLKTQTGYKLFVLAILALAGYFFLRPVLDNTPLKVDYADMLPIISVMCARFLNGQFTAVYDPIAEIWSGVKPIYLPALWLPFCSAHVFDFDLRWVTVAGIWLSVLLCVAPPWKRSGFTLFYAALLSVLLVWLHTDSSNNVIRLSEEGVVYFYYTLLAASLLIGNGWLVGVCAALCLLSRYALIGWLPYVVLCCIKWRDGKTLVKMVVTGGVTALLLLLPFGTWLLSVQAALPQQYIAHAQNVWRTYPQHFENSLGLAKFFGPQHAVLLHNLLVWGSFLVPLLFFAVTRHMRVSLTTRLLAGLQVSLTFFYAFLDVTYIYLFYTPVFVSLLITGWYLSCQKPSPVQEGEVS